VVQSVQLLVLPTFVINVTLTNGKEKYASVVNALLNLKHEAVYAENYTIDPICCWNNDGLA
jgi:hypothetical protein